MYFEGQGVGQDLAAAAGWFLMAAKQGHAEAQYCIGLRYIEGKGVKQDLAAAMGWLLKAAEQGHTDAQEALEMLSEDGY